MKQSRRIEVVIASRYLMYAYTFASLVEQEKQYKVTCITDSAKTLKSYLKEHSPSILITDIRLKDSDAYIYLKQVQKSGLNILFVTGKLETYAISYILKYGAKGIVSLNSEPKQLLKALDKLAEGKCHYNKFVRKQFVTDVTTNNFEVYEFDRKERQFLRLAIKDMSYEEIAKKMKLPVRRVEKYREDIFKRFSLRNRTALVLFILRSGLADL